MFRCSVVTSADVQMFCGCISGCSGVQYQEWSLSVAPVTLCCAVKKNFQEPILLGISKYKYYLPGTFFLMDISTGLAAMVQLVRPWPYWFMREKNDVTWILTYACIIYVTGLQYVKLPRASKPGPWTQFIRPLVLEISARFSNQQLIIHLAEYR